MFEKTVDMRKMLHNGSYLTQNDLSSEATKSEPLGRSCKLAINHDLSRRRRIFVGLGFTKTFFIRFHGTTTGFAEIAILKALELGKIEVGRDI